MPIEPQGWDCLFDDRAGNADQADRLGFATKPAGRRANGDGLLKVHGTGRRSCRKQFSCMPSFKTLMATVGALKSTGQNWEAGTRRNPRRPFDACLRMAGASSTRAPCPANSIAAAWSSSRSHRTHIPSRRTITAASRPGFPRSGSAPVRTMDGSRLFTSICPIRTSPPEVRIPLPRPEAPL